MRCLTLSILFFLCSCSFFQGKKVYPNFVMFEDEYQKKGWGRAPASEKGIIKNCPSVLLKKIMGNNFVKEDFVWSGRELSEVQIKNLVKFTKKAGRKIEKGDEILIWEPEMMVMGKAVGGERIPQYVKRNGAFEKDLLSESLIDSKPREVLQMKLHYYDGRVRTLEKVYGNAKSVDFSKAEWDMRVKTGENLSGIEHIEIAHTHPSYALTITSKDGQKFSRPNEISQGDYSMVADFLSRLPPGKKLSIKAITPNDFYYESTFVSQ